MLKSLHIENIAVIEKTDIDFTPGFNVLTGETGAGKSIIIDSINAVLGERTSRELIRSGADGAEVTALFCDLSDKAVKVIEENGFSADEDGKLLIMRKLSSNGSGSVRINGKPATASILREISKYLVNIHGQHDSQGLLVPENHITYLDLLSQNTDLLNNYYAEFKNLNAIRRELNLLETNEGEKARRTELLNYQIDEIESFDIKPGEYDKLKEQLKIAENYEKTLLSLKMAYSALNGDDEELGAVSFLKRASAEISSTGNSMFDGTLNDLENIIAVAENAALDIRKFMDEGESLSTDPEKIRLHLDSLRSLMVKYGGTEEKILEYLSSAKQELSGITASDKRIKQLSEELDTSTVRLVDLGEKLTESRIRSAELFSKKVTEALSFLNMTDSEFTVNITKGKYTKIGCDVVEFFIRTNVGDEFKPLHKIASGGELSRIMLSIKSVLSDKDDVDTLIFDEIDTGISGRAADKVGIKLKYVSDSRQVICVTHLAQIASYANNHLLIEKSVTDGKTYTEVKKLSYDDRINEIARIMSGKEITENVYKTAKELLDRSI